MRSRSIESVFRSIRNLRVLVTGDFMADSYVWGHVERISPEAPVQVVHAERREIRPGGAGNVVMNCLALGATPLPVTVIGQDEKGTRLTRLLEDLDIDPAGIIRSRKRKTTSKERIIAGSQQLLRVDDETTDILSERDNHLLLEKLYSVLPSCHVLICEDYDKGVLGPGNIPEIIAEAHRQGIPVIVDPKKKNFPAYGHADLFKPNLKEIREGIDRELEKGDITSLRKVTGELARTMSLGSVMVTLSDNGIFYRTSGHAVHVKAHKREIADVSGAGDTVVSVAGLCYALGLPDRFIAEMANLAGGMVCEHPGVVPVNIASLLREARLNKLASYL